MTMPDERFRAVNMAREFLLELTDSAKTPKVPKNIRSRALGILRHYPSNYELTSAATLAPDVFQERMDPLVRVMTMFNIQQQKEEK